MGMGKAIDRRREIFIGLRSSVEDIDQVDRGRGKKRLFLENFFFKKKKKTPFVRLFDAIDLARLSLVHSLQERKRIAIAMESNRREHVAKKKNPIISKRRTKPFGFGPNEPQQGAHRERIASLGVNGKQR